MLDIGLEMINHAMVAIEATIYSAKEGLLDRPAMVDLLRQADQIVTMAATFEYATLGGSRQKASAMSWMVFLPAD